MKKGLVFMVVATTLIFPSIQSFAEKKAQDDPSQSSDAQGGKPLYAIVGGQDQGLTPFPDNERTRRIMARTDIENEAFDLAKRGLYEEAILKYRQAMDHSLLNNNQDENGGRYGIVKVLIRQGKFEEALKEYQWFVDQNKINDAALEGKEEILVLIESKKTGSPKPVYDYIVNLRQKYKKYIPFQSRDAHSFGMISINRIIHLYNWMGDVTGGIKFMDEILSSKFLYPNERKEFERVKEAFEEDQRTGQKNHLQKVIETSNLIGW